MDERQVATKSTDVTPSILERLGLLSGVSAAVSVLVSFVYDLGFFTALGISFDDAPTTITDHIRSWLVWLPSVVIIIAVLATMALSLHRLEPAMPEDEEPVEFSQNPGRIARIARFLNNPYVVYTAAGVVLILLRVLLGDAYFGEFLFGLMICWVMFMVWVFRDPATGTLYPSWFRFSAYTLPLVTIFVFLMGFGSIKRDGVRSFWGSGNYTIQVDETQGTRSVRVLRSFEKWLLVQEDDAIVWLPIDHIRRMEVQQEPYRGLLCTLWGFGCEPTSRAEPDKTLQSDDS